MLSLQQAQTGDRVYGGFSRSPNLGQVSAAGAQGYIKRELRNKARAGVQRRIGGDGKSDNRSAVAASALQRIGGRNPHNPWGPNQGRSHNPPGPGKGKGKGKGKDKGKKPPWGPDDGRPIVNPPGPGNGNGNGQPPGTGPNGPAGVPQIQVSADGILQLPYNQDFSVEQLAAINDANDQLLSLKMQGDEQALEYGQGKRQAELAYNALKSQTLNSNAAEGTAFSSRYGTAVANNATGFANEIAGLEQGNANFLQNRGLQVAGIQNSLNQQLAALAQQYAHDLNDQAGSLGYGQSEIRLPQQRDGRSKVIKDKKRRKRDRDRKRR
jgi:hypothetical protein